MRHIRKPALNRDLRLEFSLRDLMETRLFKARFVFHA